MNQIQRQSRYLQFLLAALCVASSSGCGATFYQPLKALQKPILLNMGEPNFQGLNIHVRCFSDSETLDVQSAQKLCTNLRMLFRNQGAEVTTEVPRNGRLQTPDEEEGPRNLIVELRNKKMVQEESGTGLALLYVATFTLVPIYVESTFEQEVIVRDPRGFVLAQETLRARLVEYVGFGVWAVNWLADSFLRPKSEQVTTSRPQTRFSDDLYGQISQAAFNGRMRASVMSQVEAGREFQKVEAETQAGGE